MPEGKISMTSESEQMSDKPRVESKVIIELIQDYAISVNCEISVACFLRHDNVCSIFLFNNW